MQPEPPQPVIEAALPLPADDAKLARLRQHLKRQQQAQQEGETIALFGFGLAFISPLIFLGTINGIWIIGFLAGVIMGLLGRKNASVARNKRDKAIAELTVSKDVRLVAMLIDRMDAELTELTVCHALIALLPCLQASDAPLLNSNHHRTLNKVLTPALFIEASEMMTLRLAILKAYEQVGTAEDLPTVEKLAVGTGYAKGNKTIREAAQQCLPYLQARSEQQTARQTLLRASSAAQDGGATLLRPAHKTDDTAPQQLLRAAYSDTPPEA